MFDGHPAGRDTRPVTDLPSLRAYAHPLRLRILSLLTGAAMSAAEAARELGETQANVSYHLRKLHDVGLLDLVEEVAVRGGKAKRYRHDPGSSARVARRDHGDELVLIDALSDELRRRAGLRRLDERAHSVDAELWVDLELWQEAVAMVRTAAQRLHESAKPPRTPGTVRTSTTVYMFQMDPAS
jgi:DNA-binding transcriptional ArsR family regulator